MVDLPLAGIRVVELGSNVAAPYAGLVLAELGAWGTRHRVTTPELRVRAELLAAGGPAMWAQFMDELRELHLAQPRPQAVSPTVMAQLAQARADAT